VFPERRCEDALEIAACTGDTAVTSYRRLVKGTTRDGIAALAMIIGLVAVMMLGLTAVNGGVFPVGPSPASTTTPTDRERGPVSKVYPHGDQLGYGGANQLPALPQPRDIARGSSAAL
jgi:hypothetical protein